MTPRIFLLEDDELVVDLVQGGAAELGWEFATRAAVEGSLDAMSAWKPSLAVLDVSLPDGEGFGVCELMRADHSLAKVPVIFLTSHGDTASRLKGFSVGAQDYVAKPFEVVELLARIRAHLAIKDREDSLQGELMKTLMRERVRQDVTDMVVHDLKAPLATVKVTMELMERTGLIAQRPMDKYFGFAVESLDFALLMVNDLLDLGSGDLKAAPSPLDLRVLFARLEKIFSLQFTGRKVALAIEYPKDGPTFITDQTLILRTLINLMSNSLKFSEPGTRVSVKALRVPAGMRFEVIDEGPGIPAAEKELVFKKYYRVDTSENQAVPGAGIGLAFCHLAAGALKGKIWVEDAMPQGSRFVLELPSLPTAAA